MKKIQTISGLNEIYKNYDVFILDQWGVMHDGHKGYLSAIDCVSKLIEKNKTLIIISNSSKRQNVTSENLSKMGFNKNSFFNIMTSGEMIWQRLLEGHYKNKKLGNNCFHIFNSENKDGKKFLKGLEKYNFVNKIHDADFILGCTPFENKEMIDYIPILTIAKQKKIPFICANPDFETVKKDTRELVFCMGAVAEIYNSMGGEVYLEGKPNILIYKHSFKDLNNITKDRILAIGDSLFHDIKGAINFNIDSLLIKSGIHCKDFDDEIDKNKILPDKLKKLGILPTFLSSEFKF